MEERIKLVAKCGIDCGVCEMYMCRDNQELMDYLVSAGIPKEILPCEGCIPGGGRCPVLKGRCATYECADKKGVSYCCDCEDFPCMKLAPSSDRAGKLPHNTKVFNLCTIKRDGIEEFIQKSMEIKHLYFKGKMEIGAGPQPEKKNS